MTLYINPNADPYVWIPVGDSWVRVGALQDMDHLHLALALKVTEAELEEAVTRWANGIGLPYGILIPSPPPAPPKADPLTGGNPLGRLLCWLDFHKPPKNTAGAWWICQRKECGKVQRTRW
jgi:hypothetical protein